jgi:hypothetical protein
LKIVKHEGKRRKREKKPAAAEAKTVERRKQEAIGEKAGLLPQPLRTHINCNTKREKSANVHRIDVIKF